VRDWICLRQTIGLLLFSLASTNAAPAPRQSFNTEDWWAWHSASEPRIAPDGQWVVYVESWNDRASDSRFSNLWMASTDGRTRRRLTEGNWRDSSPRWSPDGSQIAWLSERDGRTQIHVKRVDSPQENEIATTGLAPLNIAWSPDASAIAFHARVPAKPEAAAWAPPAILARLQRSREAYFHVFSLSIRDKTAPRQLSRGDHDHSGEPAWSADGQSVLSARDDGQVWALPIAGGTEKQVTKESGRNAFPLPASDGSKIAWMSTSDNPQFYSVRKLYVMNADGSRVKMLTGLLDRDPVDLQWSSDCRTLYFLADDAGSTHVYAARNDGTVRQITSAPERLSGFTLADNGRAVVVRSSATEAGDVVTFTVDRISQPVTLAAPNEQLLAERNIGAVEELRFDSAGQKIQAWLVKPPGFDAARKYPMVLDIRDDPRSMYGVDFNLRAQILASRGFVVLCVNPRGTPGYGELFGNLLHSALPGDDFDDLMKAVDQAVSKGFVDSNRMAVLGGLLAAWTIGHTGRFQAAVARHPVADWLTDVATASDGSLRARDWRGTLPWDDPDQYWKHSPVYFAKAIRTPTLVLAGDPDPESDELYFALQHLKVDFALVRIKPAGKPSEWVLELDATLAWLARPATH